MSITTFCSEFQKRLSKVKASGTTLSEHILAFRLLKSRSSVDGVRLLAVACGDTCNNYAVLVLN